MTQYEEELYEVQQPEKIDQLLASHGYLTGEITLDAGEYKRGDVLMRTGDNFTQATLAGLDTAKDVCICARDITVPEGDTGTGGGYMLGTFSYKAVKIAGKGLREYSAAEMSSASQSLQLRKLMLV